MVAGVQTQSNVVSGVVARFEEAVAPKSPVGLAAFCVYPNLWPLMWSGPAGLRPPAGCLGPRKAPQRLSCKG